MTTSTAAPPIPAGKFTISGIVKGPNGGMQGVRIMLSFPQVGLPTATDYNGKYITPKVPPAVYVVAPVLRGWAFNPPHQTVIVTKADVTDINFYGKKL